MCVCVCVIVRCVCVSAAASSMKEPWDEKVKRVRANSPYSQLPNWSIPPIPGNL